MSFRLMVLAGLISVTAGPVLAQVSPWWTVSAESSSETGRIEELKDKRRVLVQINFRSTDESFNTQPELMLLRRSVQRILATYDGLEIVRNPEDAEFAITVTATHRVPTANSTGGGAGGNFSASLDPDVEAALEVLVLVPGATQRDGGVRPRVVWELSSQNVHGEPAPAAAFALDGFLNQLRKVHGVTKK